jgi:hypothetical protein
VKEASERTVYVDDTASKSIGMAGTVSGKRMVIERNGKLYPATWNEAEGRWGLSPSDRQGYTYSTTPTAGAHPIELWQGADGSQGREYSKWHAGNAITEVSASPPPAPATPPPPPAVAQPADKVVNQPRQKVEKKAAAQKAPRVRSASEILLERGTEDGLFPGDYEQTGDARPAVDKDTARNVSASERQGMRQVVDEGRASDVTAGMSAAQKARYERGVQLRYGANKEKRVAEAIAHYKKHPDPNLRLMAVQAEAEGQAPTQQVKARTFSHGDKFKIGDRPFRVEVDADGNMHFLDGDVDIPYVDPGQQLKIAKGSHEQAPEPDVPDEDFAPPEAKTSGQQKGLLGEAFDGPITGSKTGDMFGNVSRGPANALEAKGNNVGQSAKDNETTEMFDASQPLSQGEAIGQRGESKGPPGPLQISEATARKAPVVSAIVNALRSTRDSFSRRRFRWVESEGGRDGTTIAQKASELAVAQQGAARVGKRAAIVTLEGLNPEQKYTVIAHGLDQRRVADMKQSAASLSKATGADADAIFAALDKVHAQGDMNPGKVEQAIRDILTPAQEEAWLKKTGAGIEAGNLTNDVDWSTASGKLTPEYLSGRFSWTLRLSDAERAANRQNPAISGAIAKWNENVRPLIEKWRNESGLPMNQFAGEVDMFLNYVGEPDAPMVGSDTSVNARDRFKSARDAMTELKANPDVYLESIVAGHLKTAAEHALYDSLKNSSMEIHPNRVERIGSDESGRLVYEAELNGQRQRVAKIDVDPFGKGDERWFPERLAKEFAIMRDKVRDAQGGPMKMLNVWTSLQTKGGAMFFISREIGLAGSRIAASKAHWAHFLPVVGARGRVMAKMFEMSRNRRGQAIQGVMERLGSSGERFSEKFEPTIVDETRMGKLKKVAGKVWDFEEDLMFGRNGAENLIRRVMTESAIGMELGDESFNRVLADVDSGKVGELQAAEKILGMMSSAQKVRVQKFVNDTLGHANKEARSSWMNKIGNVFPWITVNASQIPAGFRRLMTLNVDWKRAARLAKTDPAKAAAMVAGGMMSGPVGMYLLGNILNYLFTGHGMQDNDEKRRTQVQLGDGIYWTIDEEFQRMARISGLRNLAAGKVASVDEYADALKDDALRQITYMIPPWLKFASSRGGGSAIPGWYAQRTAEEIQRNGLSKDTLTQGVLQDLQQNLAPFPAVSVTGEKETKEAAIRTAVKAMRSKDAGAGKLMEKFTPEDRRKVMEQVRYVDDTAYDISNMTVEKALEKWDGFTAEQKKKYGKQVREKVGNSQLRGEARREAVQRVQR